jgi:hypothetical protein
MARWRAAAIERLPEFQHVVAAADTVMALWIELGLEFEKAYRERNESLIGRIYAFADWCLKAPQGPDAGLDPFTAAVVGFYEHIPTIPAARDDMPRWFRSSEVSENKQVFAYLIGEQAYQDLVSYLVKNRHRYVPREGSSGASALESKDRKNSGTTSIPSRERI